MMNQPNKRVVIIGAGMVGLTTAFALRIKGIVDEIIMIDISHELLNAQVVYLQHVNVQIGFYCDVRPNDIILITCGAAQKPNQTRLEFTQMNVHIVNTVLEKLMTVAKPFYIILVTNPVDVVTYFAIKKTNFPKGMVFGTGTSLDTARLRFSLAQKLDLNPSNINGYILGEHGDSSFFADSGPCYARLSLSELLKKKKLNTHDLEREIRDTTYKIINGTFSMYYGIGRVITDIVDSLVCNRGEVFTLSTLLTGEFGLSGLCFSLPVQIDHKGAQTPILPNLSLTEIEKFKTSANAIKATINSITIESERVSLSLDTILQEELNN
jgi:L-lactate dehydrogenase